MHAGPTCASSSAYSHVAAVPSRIGAAHAITDAITDAITHAITCGEQCQAESERLVEWDRVPELVDELDADGARLARHDALEAAAADRCELEGGLGGQQLEQEGRSDHLSSRAGDPIT